ncbi:hypothetical protein [Paraburkholderia gardini]|uniref:hypothetical protein n=1 Tax=Paraburkholderia gardini TaxID=2823469 RepID=UPI001E32F6D1|nr:hypothetical protein [Paraburkholderia gardini]
MPEQYGWYPGQILIHHHAKSGYGAWVEREEQLCAGDEPRWIEHPPLGPLADFVALPLDNLGGTTTFSWKEDAGDEEHAVGPADVVSVVGFPFGLAYGGFYPVWATGFVATEPNVDCNELPTFLIDSRTRQGQSGSPVIKHSNGGTIKLKSGASRMGGAATTFLGIY